MVSDATERARATLERLATLDLTPRRFEAAAWRERMPSADNPAALKAWLAELPHEPAPESEFDKWAKEQQQKREAKREQERIAKAEREQRALPEVVRKPFGKAPAEAAAKPKRRRTQKSDPMFVRKQSC